MYAYLHPVEGRVGGEAPGVSPRPGVGALPGLFVGVCLVFRWGREGGMGSLSRLVCLFWGGGGREGVGLEGRGAEGWAGG